MTRVYDKLMSTWIGTIFFRPVGSLYAHLSRDLFFHVIVVAVVPTLLMGSAVYFQFKKTVEQEHKDQLVWNMQYTKKLIDNFLEEQMAALRFLFGSYTIKQLSDQTRLQHIFTQFRDSFPNFVDLGLVDSNGMQITYEGPYNLLGKNSRTEDWFQKTLISGSFISDVFLGKQEIPHVLMAIKSPISDKGDFWVIRAAINTKVFDHMVSTMNLRSKADTFIVNEKGFLQNRSRFHGNILSRYSLPVHATADSVVWTDEKKEQDKKVVIAYTSLENKDWVLTFVQPLSENRKYLIPEKRIMISALLSGLVFVFMLTWLLTRNFADQLKKAEHEKDDVLQTAEHTNRLASIGRLAAGVAHEINNPLAIINEDAGLMQDLTEMSDDFPYKEKFIELLRSIHSSVKRCRAITHRLLGFARQMDVTAEVIDINALVREVFGFLENEAVNRNIYINMNLKEDLPTIESDRGQLQQVFLNIINNAMDAVDNEGEIDITTWHKDGNICVKISDNGCGIPQDKLERIFEPFFSTKGRGKGTGLGLSITYGIINKLGGKISVKSQVNKGTEFTIELPRKFRM